MTEIKKFFLLCLLLTGGALFADRLFLADFDDYTTDAVTAKGVIKSSGLGSKDLQLRMFPGPDGKGNSFCFSIGERIGYPAQGNVRMDAGTLAFWYCPVNYDFNNNEQFSIITFTNGGDNASGWSRIWALKSNWGPFIILSQTWQLPGAKKPLSRQVQMMVDPKVWGPGKWHHVAITWDKDALRLYLDGVALQRPEKIGKPRYFNGKDCPPDKPVSELTAAETIPAAGANSKIFIGDIWSQRYTTALAKEFRTAVDDVQIHDRPLSPKEIRALCEKYRPAQTQSSKANLTSVPKGDVWTTVFLKTPMGAPATKVEAAASTRRDDRNLYVKFTADFPFAVTKNQKRDGNIWEDDSFELHLISPDKQTLQFIVNGAGAVFDSRNQDASWSPAGVTAKTVVADGKTVAELTIPLEALGTLDGLWKADFCLSRHIGHKNDFYRWSPVIFDNKFTATSDLIFLDKPLAVDPVLKPGLTGGKLHLTKNAAAGVQCTCSYSVDGQTPVVCGGNVPVWESTLPAGKVALRVEAQAGKQEIYRWQLNCDIEYPLELTFNTMPAERKLAVELNFGNAGEELLKKIGGAGLKGRAMLLSSAGKELAAAEFTARQSRTPVELKLPETMPAGDGIIVAEAGGLRREVTYRIPEELPAFKLHLGDDRSVPAPWHPVRVVSDRRIEVLDRVYSFDGASPLPVSITVKGAEILTEPVVLTCNGKPFRWSGFAIGERRDDYVVVTAAGTSGDAKVAFRGELWFDGMYRMRYTLNAGAVNDFRISTAVKAEYALFAMNPYLVPWKNDAADVSVAIRHAGSGYHTSILWLTGHEKGLCLFTASTANWYNRPGTQGLQARRRGNDVTLQGVMIDKSAPAVKNAAYDMVLQATPPRRPAKDFRRFNFCSYGKSEEVRHEFNENTGPGAITSFGGVLPKYPDKYDFQWAGRSCPIYHYTLPGHLSNTERVFDYFDKRQRNMPGTTHSGTEFGAPWMSWQYCTNAGPDAADVYCWWTDKLMKEHRRCGGLYFDVASVRTCENEQHGCAGVDAFGQKFVSNDAMGLRNFFLRVYRVVKKYRGNVILHCHVAFVPFVHDFIDSFAPGENTYRQVVKNLWYPYTEEISPEIYQSELNWRKAGVPYAMILQQGRACDLMPKYKQYKQEIYGNPEYAIRSLTAMLVHDLNVWGHCVNRQPIDKLWKIFREVNIDEVTDYHGYWESDAVRSKTDKVYCGWYEWPLDRRDLPYSRILIVSNFNRSKVNAALEIDWKKLGVPAPEIVDDIWERRRVPLKDMVKTAIPPAHFLMIGIR